MAKNENRVISKGRAYKNRETGERVVVFHVDNLHSNVRYAPEGIGSGREYGMDIETFMNTFEDAPLVDKANA